MSTYREPADPLRPGERERNRVIYVTSDGSDWLAVDVPFGLIPPPTIQLHRPLAGPVEFYHADSYRLPIPDEATQAVAGDQP